MTTGHDELQGTITKLLRVTNWQWLHVRKSIGRGQGGRKWQTTTNIKGWPDLAPCWSELQPGRLVAIEVKILPDKLRPEQIVVRDSLLASGWEFYVVDDTTDLSAFGRILQRRG